MEHRQISSSRAPTPTRWCASSTPRPAAHTSYQMTGAATGRLASTDPNLQNIPVRTEGGSARSGRPSSPSRATSSCRPTIRRSSSGCWRMSPTSPRSRRLLRAATTSTPSPPARCSACRSRAWTRWCGGAPRPSTSASSTASRPSGLANQLGIGQREAREYIAKYFLRYRHPRLHGDDQEICAQERLREDAVRPQDPSEVHQREGPGHARLRRSARRSTPRCGAAPPTSSSGR